MYAHPVHDLEHVDSIGAVTDTRAVAGEAFDARYADALRDIERAPFRIDMLTRIASLLAEHPGE